MNRIGKAIAVGLLMVAGPAFAGQLDNLDTPYASRGACESANAGFSNEVRDFLLEQFPNFFDSEGDVRKLSYPSIPVRTRSIGWELVHPGPSLRRH